MDRIHSTLITGGHEAAVDKITKSWLSSNIRPSTSHYALSLGVKLIRQQKGGIKGVNSFQFWVHHKNCFYTVCVECNLISLLIIHCKTRNLYLTSHTRYSLSLGARELTCFPRVCQYVTEWLCRVQTNGVTWPVYRCTVQPVRQVGRARGGTLPRSQA